MKAARRRALGALETVVSKNYMPYTSPLLQEVNK